MELYGWEKFCKTGKIEDFLNYKKMENKNKQYSEAIVNADKNKGNSTTPPQYR